MEYNAPSEALLTEILVVVQQLAATVDELKEKVDAMESELREMRTTIDDIIKNGFPDGDLKKHKGWHERIWLGKFFR